MSACNLAGLRLQSELMLNNIWAFLVIGGLLVAGLLGKLAGADGVVELALADCKKAVMNIALPLAGMMMFWLGVLRLIEKAGVLALVSRAMSPLMRLLFPQVPADHPATGAMIMNLSANMLGLGNSASAQTQPSAPVGGLSAEWMAAAQGWVEQAVAAAQSAQQAGPLRLETVLGEPDSRLRLAPCARVEPFVPPGTRLWGKTRLGLRCAEGVSRWSIFLPLTVKAFGPAWVVRGELAAGTVLNVGDAMQAEVDWAQEPSPILATPAQWLGQVAVRTLGTGQALRQALLRPAQVFQAGSQVRVLAQGAGFQIVADGLALSAGVIGQSARVRMDNGRVMSGLVSDHKTVQLDL